ERGSTPGALRSGPRTPRGSVGRPWRILPSAGARCGQALPSSSLQTPHQALSLSLQLPALRYLGLPGAQTPDALEVLDSMTLEGGPAPLGTVQPAGLALALAGHAVTFANRSRTFSTTRSARWMS